MTNVTIYDTEADFLEKMSKEYDQSIAECLADIIYDFSTRNK